MNNILAYIIIYILLENVLVNIYSETHHCQAWNLAWKIQLKNTKPDISFVYVWFIFLLYMFNLNSFWLIKQMKCSEKAWNNNNVRNEGTFVLKFHGSQGGWKCSRKCPHLFLPWFSLPSPFYTTTTTRVLVWSSK